MFVPLKFGKLHISFFFFRRDYFLILIFSQNTDFVSNFIQVWSYIIVAGVYFSTVKSLMYKKKVKAIKMIVLY